MLANVCSNGVSNRGAGVYLHSAKCIFKSTIKVLLNFTVNLLFRYHTLRRTPQYTWTGWPHCSRYCCQRTNLCIQIGLTKYKSLPYKNDLERWTNNDLLVRKPSLHLSVPFTLSHCTTTHWSLAEFYVFLTLLFNYSLKINQFKSTENPYYLQKILTIRLLSAFKRM